MCNNHYLLSIQKVFKLFSPDTPKTMERIIQELGDDVFDLTFDGESLYKFVTKMEIDKKPPEWEQKWVNLITGKFLGKAKDHCSYWRRRLFAWTIQVPLVAAFVFGFMFTRWTLATIRLLCGFRVAWQPLVRPWRFNTSHIWEMTKEGNVFSPDVGYEVHGRRNYYHITTIIEDVVDMVEKSKKGDHPPYTVASFFKLRGGCKNVTTPFLIPLIPMWWLGVFVVIFGLNTYILKPEHVFSASVMEMLGQTALYGIAMPMFAILMLPIVIQAVILALFAIIFPVYFLFNKLIPRAKERIVTSLKSWGGVAQSGNSKRNGQGNRHSAHGRDWNNKRNWSRSCLSSRATL